MTSTNNITLIFGPMFSGKTTKLIEIYEKYIKLYGKEKCIALNYALDKRYGENEIISHDKLKIDCMSILDLGEFIENNETLKLIQNADYIFINEAQFFENIDTHVLYLKEILKKNVILCGLDLDFKKQPFGTMMNLVSKANEIFKMTGQCHNIKDGCINPSEYSHRIIANENQVLIGSSEYIPLCESCYNKANNM